MEYKSSILDDKCLVDVHTCRLRSVTLSRVGLAGAPYGGPEGPPAPPSAWQAMLHTIGGVVHFFGRLSFLVDENAHAVHFFVQALLQLLDRCVAQLAFSVHQHTSFT